MAYVFYLNGVQLPVTPKTIQVSINGKNETMVLMDQGEVNVLKTPGLTEVSFDALLPNIRYPFAVYPGGFRGAEYYLSVLEQLMAAKKPFQLVVSRSMAGKTGLYGTSLKVSLEEYTMKEDAGEYGMDVLVSLKLKQYRNYGTKTCQISGDTALILSSRELSGATSGTEYTVQEGESLPEIAQRCYGDSSQYVRLQEANGIEDPNRLTAGQTLVVPR